MTDHTQCHQCIALQAEVLALKAEVDAAEDLLSKFRRFQADVQRSLRTLQMPPERPEDRAERENTEDKHCPRPDPPKSP